MEAASAARPSAPSALPAPSSPSALPGLAAVPAPCSPASDASAPAEPSPVMALLRDGLPLTLLLDLAWGVSSQEVYAAEPADLSWLRPPAVA